MNRTLMLVLLLGARLAAVDLPPQVSAEVPWGNYDRYIPVMVQAQSPQDGHFEITATQGGNSAAAAVELSAGATSTITVLLPGSLDPSPDAIVHWRGPGDHHGDLVARCPGRSWRALAVVDRDEAIPLKRFAFVTTTPWSHYGNTGDLVARVALAALPQRWQGYPGTMALLISAADDRRLDDERRAAIATWAAAGGTLAVAESGQTPPWRALGVTPIALDAEHGEQALRERIESAVGSDVVPALQSVPGTEHVPATGFALVAVLFAVVVGPLNLWWVRRRGNRHLLLLTTPALSLATCAGLLVVNLLIEGVALRRCATQVTLLDQQRAQALTWTRATYYGGFAVNGVALDGDGCARTFDQREFNEIYSHYPTERNQLAIDWRQGQHLDGWIPARANRQLLFTVPRPERARLSVERVGKGWQMTNGLGVPIRLLRWRDPANHEWQAAHLAFGASATLTTVNVGGMTAPAAADSRQDCSLDRGGELALRTAATTRYGFTAELEAPFGTLTGPVATDVVAPHCVVVGLAIPAGETP